MKKTLLLSLFLVLIVPTHNSFALDMQTADKCFAPFAIASNLAVLALSGYYSLDCFAADPSEPILGAACAMLAITQATAAVRDIYKTYIHQKAQSKYQQRGKHTTQGA